MRKAGLVTAYRQRAAALSDARLMPLIDELEGVVRTLETEVGYVGVWPPVQR